MPDFGETFSHLGKLLTAKGNFNPNFGNKHPHLGNFNPQSGNLHTEKGSKHPTNGNLKDAFVEKRKPKRKTANAQKNTLLKNAQGNRKKQFF